MNHILIFFIFTILISLSPEQTLAIRPRPTLSLDTELKPITITNNQRNNLGQTLLLQQASLVDEEIDGDSNGDGGGGSANSVNGSLTQLQRTNRFVQIETKQYPYYFASGLIFMYLGTTLLWLIERKVYRIHKNLKNAKLASEEIRVVDSNNNNNNIEHNLNGELIVARGLMRTFSPICDKVMGVTVYNAIVLKRNVEIFQYGNQENGILVESSFTPYITDASILEESNALCKKISNWKVYNPNNSSIQFLRSETMMDEHVCIGDYQLNQSQLEQINARESLILKPVLQSNIKASLKVLFETIQYPFKPYIHFTDKYVYVQQSPETVTINDFRIWYEYIPCDRITVACSLEDSKFIPYDYEQKKFHKRKGGYTTILDSPNETKSRETSCVDTIDNIIDSVSCINMFNIYRSNMGKNELKTINWVFYEEMVPKNEVFNRMIGENQSQKHIKWIIRFISLQLIVLGYFILIYPMYEAFLMIELFNSHILLGILIISYTLALSSSTITISLAWFFYNPLASLFFLILSFITIFMLSLMKQF